MTRPDEWSGPTRLVVLALLAVMLGSAIRNIKEDGDFRGYIEVGDLVLRGGDIYADSRPDVNTWPPLFAVVCVPFALLARVSVYLARAVWLGLNVACIVALFRLAVDLVYRRPLGLGDRPGTVALASAAVLGPLVLSARFLLGNLDRLQINMVILAACLTGAAWIVRGRAAAGGALIGFAAAVKVLPIFFLPYFAWKRWWTALAAALTTGALASLAPVLVFGPERFGAYVRHWLALSAGSWPVRKGNQSVYAMVDRLYTHDAIVWDVTQKRLTASNDPVVATIVYGLLALVAVVFVLVARRGDRQRASPASVPGNLTIVSTRSSLHRDRARARRDRALRAARLEALLRLPAARTVRAVAGGVRRRLRPRGHGTAAPRMDARLCRTC